jgi:hypothetical protein
MRLVIKREALLQFYEKHAPDKAQYVDAYIGGYSAEQIVATLQVR